MNKEARDLAQILGFNIEHRATNIMLERFFKKAQESEREACAKILDEMAEKDKLARGIKKANQKMYPPVQHKPEPKSEKKEHKE